MRKITLLLFLMFFIVNMNSLKAQNINTINNVVISDSMKSDSVKKTLSFQLFFNWGIWRNEQFNYSSFPAIGLGLSGHIYKRLYYNFDFTVNLTSMFSFGLDYNILDIGRTELFIQSTIINLFIMPTFAVSIGPNIRIHIGEKTRIYIECRFCKNQMYRDSDLINLNFGLLF
jgi:hypothetical protein